MGTASERRRGKRRGSAGSSRRSCCRVGPSSYHRRLVLEPLEDRRLLSFDVTGWTDPIPAWTLEDNVECTGAYTGNGHLIDVYIKDLDYGFYTPSEWTWTPSCFEDPIIDLALKQANLSGGLHEKTRNHPCFCGYNGRET